MKKLIEQIPVKLRVCLPVFIIGLVILLISSSFVTITSPVIIVITVISAVVTAAGMISLIIYWVSWLDL